ncbi:septum site-determining protein MinC [Anaeroselena agilis]|uniref:Probable septum site-determining protein MinC n=1 Tax=Anaeroselena agilis TaxID=3063788 RepID=A0ABU3NZN9_9FIRM|nr:septum site-determining protein MinC [Selenomonadales bacterium 4137-cl]
MAAKGEMVAFKGVNGEVQLVLNTENFAAALEQLAAKLAAAEEFFPRGTMVKVPAARLGADERRQLDAVFGEFGLVCAPEWPDGRDGEEDAPATAERDGYEINALVVARTVRSGQKVVHPGSVVVIGDVNPGAQVIAGRDIIILGACRGVAHAGAYGDETATITANRIVATQLRIAGLIARAPDDLDKPAYIETARIKEGSVVIEPANR